MASLTVLREVLNALKRERVRLTEGELVKGWAPKLKKLDAEIAGVRKQISEK